MALSKFAWISTKERGHKDRNTKSLGDTWNIAHRNKQIATAKLYGTTLVVISFPEDESLRHCYLNHAYLNFQRAQSFQFTKDY